MSLFRKTTAPAQPDALQWHVDESALHFDALVLRGWCHYPGRKIVRMEVVYAEASEGFVVNRVDLRSDDVAAAVDPAATHCRFDARLSIPAALVGKDFCLRVTLKDGSVLNTEPVLATMRGMDNFHRSWVNFLSYLKDIPEGTILEIGSRARSAMTCRHLLPEHLGYVGLDILSGPNVDVVGDAHRLEQLFGTNRFVAAISMSVFEHLAMPWKVVLELNRVLRPGGIVFTGTHQSWPVHEEPWDFWRFSSYSWRALFNEATGFEVVETAMGEPARLFPRYAVNMNKDLPNQPVWLGSSAITRKISETTLTWPVDLETAAAGMYPKGELTTPPV